MAATVISVQEFARIGTTPCAASLDQAQVPRSAFDYLVRLSATFRKGGASLAVIEDAQHLRLDNYVGVIETPCGTRLEILPKHTEGTEAVGSSRALLRRMIRRALDLPPRQVGAAILETFDVPLTEWVMKEFLASLQHVVKRGVRFDYQRVEEEMRFLRGQLNIPRQLRQTPGRQHLFQLRHDVYLVDRAENRLLKSAALRVLAATRSPDTWRLANELCGLLHEVPPSREIDGDFRSWRTDRNMAHYLPAKPWCHLVLGDAMPMAVAGVTMGMSLLFPMERLFERYVADWLSKHLQPAASLTSQARHFSLCEHNGSAMFQLRPDLVARMGPQAWIMDTKWKRLDRSAVPQKYGLAESDFYQMFAYGHTYQAGTGDLALIYPRSSSFTDPLRPFTMPGRRESVPPGQLRLWVLPFDLDDDSRGLMMPTEEPFAFVRTPAATA